MRLGEIWDYFMRRKLLLLSVIVASAAVVVLGCKLCFGKADEIMETVSVATNEPAKINVPKTGEIVADEIVANESGASCIVALTSSADDDLGGGVNQDDSIAEGDAEITFWGAETPDAKIKIAQPDDTAAKVELIIVIAGGVATVAVVGLAKFIFDHYVR